MWDPRAVAQLSACYLSLLHGDLPAGYTWAKVDTDYVILETAKRAGMKMLDRARL